GIMRTLRLLVALAPLLAATAHAGTLQLRWNACFGDGGVVNRSFACDTNLGSEQLVATFTLPSPVDSVTTITAFVQIAFQGTTLPAWWEFAVAGNCRPTSLATVATLPVGASSCIDFINRSAQYLYQYPVYGGPNFARLVVYSPFIPQGT